MTSDFGIVICCCRYDYFLAKGSVASVRHAYPDMPVTLFTDDEFDAGPLVKRYGVNVFRRKDVRNSFLREINTGWGLPKMTLLWESPYERFLYLDADTIVWGDVVGTHLKPMDWDLCIDVGDVEGRPWLSGMGTDDWINREYFNTSILERAIPDFPWRKYSGQYFCTGTFAARRGALSLDEYKHVLAVKEATPGLFPMGEMPLLNIMAFRAMEAGSAVVKRRPFQMMCDYSNVEMLEHRYHIRNGQPLVRDDDHVVLHFTQPKPLMNSDGFFKPFAHFRREGLQDARPALATVARPILTLEEVEWRSSHWWRNHGHALHGVLRPLIAPIRRRYRGGR